jgi:hypothetical protein
MTLKQVIHIASRRRIPLIAIAILLVIDFAAYGLLAMHFRPSLDRAREEWFAKRRTAAGEQRDQSRPALYAQGRKDLEEWRSRVIAKKDFAPFLSRLFTVASRHNLQLAGITYKPSVERGRPLAAYIIGFSVKGSYSASKAFLADLLAMREMVVVDSIFLTSAKATEDQVELRLQLTSYFKVDRP